MSTLGLCLVVFFTACLFTYATVFNNEKFSNFFFLIYGSAVVIIYCLIYGLIGVVLFFLLKGNAFAIEENNTNLTGPYVSAFFIGFATKGISEIKFLDVRHAGESFPIGLKTISHFIDKWFDEECDAICLDRFYAFITPYRIKYKDVNLDLFKKRIEEVLSLHPSHEKVGIFSKEVIANATKPTVILHEIIKVFGKRTLDTINRNFNLDP